MHRSVGRSLSIVCLGSKLFWLVDILEGMADAVVLELVAGSAEGMA